MTTPHDEPPRDAWLREALRHAPDADAAPSPELSAAILRQARDAVKVAARPAAASHPLLQLWSWLARPPVAAGFATVMVATLVGVMWWDKPLDETLPRSEPPPATVAQSSAPAPTPAPAPASIATPLAAAAPPPAQEEAAKAAARAAKEAAPATTARRDDARERASTERSRSKASDESRTRSAAPAATPPPPAASPAPAPANESPAKPAIADARDDAAAVQRGAAAQGFAKSAPAPAPAAAPAQRRQEAATLTPVIDQPERWTWQRGGAEQAMTPGLQRWLVQLDRAIRWQPADTAPPADGVVVLRLRRDGTLHATLQLGSDTAWLTPAGGAPVMAPLSPATAAVLQAALIAATP